MTARSHHALGQVPSPSLTRLELWMVLTLFFLLAGANGFRFSFNSALPCGVLATGLLALRLLRTSKPPIMTSFQWAISGTLALWFAGATMSTLVHLSYETLLALYAGYLVPLLIFASLVGREIGESQKRWILLAAASGALIPWLWGNIAYLAAFGVPSPLELLWNRYDVTRMSGYHKVAFGNTSHMAHYISVALPPLLLMFIHSGTSSRSRAIFGFASVLAFTNLLFIFSRGALLTLLLLIVFWLLVFRSARSLVLAGALIAAFTAGLHQFEEEAAILSERTVLASEDVGIADGSVGTRIASIAVGWRIFVENPMFGVGPGLTYRHNEWSIAHQINVEEAASIGIAGLISTSALVLLVFGRSAHVILRGPPVSTANLAMWSGVLGWTIYAVLAGGLLHMGMLIAWAGLLYGFLAMSISD